MIRRRVIAKRVKKGRKVYVYGRADGLPAEPP